jgi:hypothetical protein
LLLVIWAAWVKPKINIIADSKFKALKETRNDCINKLIKYTPCVLIYYQVNAVILLGKSIII